MPKSRQPSGKTEVDDDTYAHDSCIQNKRSRNNPWFFFFGTFRQEFNQGVLDKPASGHLKDGGSGHEKGPYTKAVFIQQPDQEIKAAESKEKLLHIHHQGIEPGF
jgi:hypothetical protein